MGKTCSDSPHKGILKDKKCIKDSTQLVHKKMRIKTIKTSLCSFKMLKINKT